MKRLLKILTGRFFAFIVLILLQLALLLAILSNLLERVDLFFSITYVLSGITVFYILSREENPAYKMIWVILLLAVPVFAVPFYIIFGNKRDSKKVARQVALYNQYVRNEDAAECSSRAAEVRERLRSYSRSYSRQSDYIWNLTRSCVYDRTSASYYPTGEAAFIAILEDMRKATRFILIETFIIDFGYLWDSVLDVLKKKVQQRVEVYLLYDDVGTIKNFPPHYQRTLSETGIKVAVFNRLRAHLNPRLNYRDHRKLIIIDGDIGYTGGINIADEYINRKIRFGHWKDTAVRLHGDAVISMTMMFFQQWGFTTKEYIDIHEFSPRTNEPGDGFIQPFGDSPLDTYNIAENAYIQMINHANNYLWLTTPYLILDTQMITALTLASESGVDVRIITPSIPDKWYVHAVSRSHYGQLIRSGVKIYEYTPGFIHAKMFVSDDRAAIVGTTNMDYRSFYLHFECGVAFFNSSVVHQVRNDIQKILSVSRQVTEKMVDRTPPATRFVRNLLKLFSPVL